MVGILDRDYTKEDFKNNKKHFEYVFNESKGEIELEPQFIKTKNPYWKESPKKIYSFERPDSYYEDDIKKRADYIKNNFKRTTYTVNDKLYIENKPVLVDDFKIDYKKLFILFAIVIFSIIGYTFYSIYSKLF